jgi:hypothetical protein
MLISRAKELFMKALLRTETNYQNSLYVQNLFVQREASIHAPLSYSGIFDHINYFVMVKLQ